MYRPTHILGICQRVFVNISGVCMKYMHVYMYVHIHACLNVCLSFAFSISPIMNKYVKFSKINSIS